MSDAEQLARFRVAVASGHLPRDLGAWALQQLDPARSDIAQRRGERDELLREAARRLRRDNSSRWAAAKVIDAWLGELRQSPGLIKAWQPDSSPQACVRDAFILDRERPGTLRQLLNIIDQ